MRHVVYRAVSGFILDISFLRLTRRYNDGQNDFTNENSKNTLQACLFS